MNTDLFSSLDGYQFLSYPSMIFLLFMSTSMFLSVSNHPFFNYMSSMWISKYFPNLKNFNMFIYSTMILILLNNLIGLTPFVYGFSSSLWHNASMAFLLWGSLLIAGWIYSPLKAAAHLAPAGAPAILIPFLVIIETVSILIRPLTLTVRLVANISAGHIVMALIASTLSALPSFSSTFLLLFIMSAYMMFEFFVSMIQAYIFTLLLSLYAEEHP
uniref:ATP synthase subunit a n=1 Tax=Naesiotus nux TaxID=1755238 RepID=A0A0S2IA12_NAENU|nr:ATP synthase F0 subunit 6 [Naesiotus nux]ALO20564.1 ATP synthase F0 subunit 6 [Naesiotus nux]